MMSSIISSNISATTDFESLLIYLMANKTKYKAKHVVAKKIWNSH